MPVIDPFNWEFDFSSLQKTLDYIKANPKYVDMEQWEGLCWTTEGSVCGTIHCIGGTQLVLHYGVTAFSELPEEVNFNRKFDGVDILCLQLMGVPMSHWGHMQEYAWLYFKDKWPRRLRSAYFHAETDEATAAVICQVIQYYIDNKGVKGE